MALRLNSRVVAAHDIKRGDVRVPVGTPGRIIARGGIITLRFTVQFEPAAGEGPVTVFNRLTWRDVTEMPDEPERLAGLSRRA
ncbi:hypothetical protein GCM10022236_45300 [Microlunatus ginsengisoli]|jgi:hypothetical protein|uniref:Uncharacterized protein n=1 Tax=Microlunatus ginsengisoli TaxID=363863 RepID=A0ABP7AQU9_9ACTN